MKAKARPLSAGERSRSLASAALVAVAVLEKLIGRMVSSTTSASDCTNGISMPIAVSSRQATTTSRRLPLRRVTGFSAASPTQLVSTISSVPA